MTWDDQVPAIFIGGGFAHHPADEQRAFEWLTDLRSRGIGWRATRQQLKDYLLSNTREGKPVTVEHRKYVNAELRRAEKMMKPWLLD